VDDRGFIFTLAIGMKVGRREEKLRKIYQPVRGTLGVGE